MTPGTIGPVVAADLCGALGAPAPDEQARLLGCTALGKVVAAARERASDNAFGSPGIFTFGWIQDNCGVGALAAAAGRAGVAADGLQLAAAARDYALGRNPWGASFIVGPATNEVKQPHHPAFLKGTPAQVLNGAVVGGATDPSSLRPFELTLGRSRFRQFNSDRIVYEDRRANFVTSEVALSYSASCVLLAAAENGS